MYRRPADKERSKADLKHSHAVHYSSFINLFHVIQAMQLYTPVLLLNKFI